MEKRSGRTAGSNFQKMSRRRLRWRTVCCRKYFLFNSKWDLEQTDEPVQFDGAIDWTYMPADDPEFVWQFNRHRFFMTLGQAYQMTGMRNMRERLWRLRRTGSIMSR